MPPSRAAAPARKVRSRRGRSSAPPGRHAPSKRPTKGPAARRRTTPRLPELSIYPYPMVPIFREKPWGGGGLRKVAGKVVPRGKRIGETWEIAWRPDAATEVAAGRMKGTGLDDLILRWPKEVLGADHALRFSKRFPLLVKFIDASGMLSLQVHPSDEFAARYEDGDDGKMELWYILDVQPGSKLYRGVLPGTSLKEFQDRVQAGTVAECMNVVDVEPGDVIFLPPGTVHAAGGGITFLEVSQNSDVTYRIHDWGRAGAEARGRTLHLDKALRMIDFYSMGISKYKPSPIRSTPYRRKLLQSCGKFTAEVVEIRGGRASLDTGRERFRVYTFLQGNGKIAYGAKLLESMPFEKGQTFLIPAALGAHAVVGRGAVQFADVYIP